MNCLVLLMICTILGMNSLVLLMTWKTLGCQLRVMVNMKDYGLWAQGFRSYEQQKAIDEMNYS